MSVSVCKSHGSCLNLVSIFLAQGVIGPGIFAFAQRKTSTFLTTSWLALRCCLSSSSLAPWFCWASAAWRVLLEAQLHNGPAASWLGELKRRKSLKKWLLLVIVWNWRLWGMGWTWRWNFQVVNLQCFFLISSNVSFIFILFLKLNHKRLVMSHV